MQGTRGWAVAAGVMLAFGCADRELGKGKGAVDAFPEQLDFGPVALGQDRVLEVRLTNTGRVPYQLRTIASSVPNVAVEDFQAGVLAAGQSSRFRVRFAPAIEGRVTGALAVATEDGGELSLPLDGQGVRALVEVKPQEIDFGQVDIDTVRVENVSVSNPSAVATTVRFSIEGEDADQFSSSFAGTELTLQPGEHQAIPIAFRPVRMGLASAQLSIDRCSGCTPAAVSLVGEGLLGNLNVFPTRLNFGRVALGAQSRLSVTLSNDGNKRVLIKEISLRNNPAGVFALSRIPTLPLDPGHFTPITFDVTFAPTAAGPARAALEILVVSDNSERIVKFPVLGEGGASCVKVLPAEIDFQMVPEGMSATRTADVLNLCSYDVTVLEATPVSTLNGYFSLAQQPAAMVVPAGKVTPIRVTYTPRAGTTQAEGHLLVRIAERNSTSAAEVRLKGASRSFAPCEWRLVPTALDFGSVPVGAVATLGVALENVGKEQCFVGTMQLGSGTDPAFFAHATTSLLLDPGQKLLLQIEFKPGSVGDFAGLVEAWVNHPTNNHPLATITGRGVQGCFALQPTTVDFGVTKLSCGPKTRGVIGVNNCSAPVTISDVRLEGQATTDFALTTLPGLPMVLHPGRQVGFSLSYEPADESMDSAALRVTADGVSYTAGMVGLGLTQPTRTDSFVQDPQAKVDVLFVIDNSGSMMEEQQNLGQNFAAFLSAAQAQMVDYQIAVTTTGIEASTGGWSVCPGGVSGGEAGRLFPVTGASPRLITRTTPNAAQHFANNVNVGWCHWNEQGLEAAYRALSPPLVNSSDDSRTPLPNDGNAGFLRPDAKLALVFVSDEEDASSRQVSFYETFFKGLKGNDPTLLSISAIVGPSVLSSCPTASSSGNRYISLAHATGGVVENICTPDWAKSLQNLSSSAFGPRRRFRLSETPSDPAQITVKVNGMPIYGTWTYDAASRTVTFDENAAPGPGALIQITYPLGC
jgi:Flagellar-associated PapD-like